VLSECVLVCEREKNDAVADSETETVGVVVSVIERLREKVHDSVVVRDAVSELVALSEDEMVDVSDCDVENEKVSEPVPDILLLRDSDVVRVREKDLETEEDRVWV
jgi:hypothetical protein